MNCVYRAVPSEDDSNEKSYARVTIDKWLYELGVSLTLPHRTSRFHRFPFCEGLQSIAPRANATTFSYASHRHTWNCRTPRSA